MMDHEWNNVLFSELLPQILADKCQSLKRVNLDLLHPFKCILYKDLKLTRGYHIQPFKLASASQLFEYVHCNNNVAKIKIVQVLFQEHSQLLLYFCRHLYKLFPDCDDLK